MLWVVGVVVSLVNKESVPLALCHSNRGQYNFLHRRWCTQAVWNSSVFFIYLYKHTRPYSVNPVYYPSFADWGHEAAHPISGCMTTRDRETSHMCLDDCSAQFHHFLESLLEKFKKDFGPFQGNFLQIYLNSLDCNGFDLWYLQDGRCQVSSSDLRTGAWQNKMPLLPQNRSLQTWW